MGYVILLSALAISAQPTNLLVHGGFEASQAGVSNVWRGHDSVSAVDESQRHSGRQCLRLEAAAVIAQRIPGQRFGRPGTFIASAWSRTQDVTGRKDNAYALYIDVAYRPPAALEETRQELPRLQQKVAALDLAIREAEARGRDVSDQRVTRAVARQFLRFIPLDAQLGADDYPADMIDFSILGRPETLKRIDGLARFELRETERLVDRAIKELASEPPRRSSRRPATGKIDRQNGTFYRGDRPVFIAGIHNTLGALERPEMVETLKDLGANLLGPAYVGERFSRGWDRFDDTDFQKRLLPMYAAAQRHGFLVVPGLWSYQAPQWLAELAPDIQLEDGKGWFRDYLDLDHPLAERYQRTLFAFYAAQLKKCENNFGHSLMGEEWCDPGYRGKHTGPRYAKWLAEKHRSIEALNRVWDTSYKDFAAAAGPESAKTKGGHYDWLTFNEWRLTTLNQWQIDGLLSADPDAWPSCWPAAGGLVSAPLGGFDPAYGRNREDTIRQSVIAGWDGGIFAREAGPTTRRLPESHWAKYNMGWRDEMIYYDFAKSVCPEKPIFDPELHSITSVYHISPLGVPADYFRTSLWLEHLHGMSAHLLWWWGRRDDGTPLFGEFLGGLLTQPQLLDCWGRTVRELDRLAEYVVLFPQSERRVRILYAEPSAIHEPKVYPLEIRDAYEALYFLDYPVGFATERTGLNECSLLVIAGTRYIPEETVRDIAEYAAQGGRVAMIGRDLLKYDEYGRPRRVPEVLARIAPLSGKTPAEYAPQLDRLMEQLPLWRPVRVVDRQGRRVWGVECRSARNDKRLVFYLVNLGLAAQEIMLKGPPGGAPLDLISGAATEPARPFKLEPRRPMLVEMSFSGPTLIAPEAPVGGAGGKP